MESNHGICNDYGHDLQSLGNTSHIGLSSEILPLLVISATRRIATVHLFWAQEHIVIDSTNEYSESVLFLGILLMFSISLIFP